MSKKENYIVNSKLIEEFEQYLKKPVISFEKQNFKRESNPNLYFRSDPKDLEALFASHLDDNANKKGFREHLLEVIDKKKIALEEKIKERGATKGHNKFDKYSSIYRASGVSKFVFSKLLNFSINPPHKPSKETVAALTIGLELNIEEAERFYNAAGYCLGETDFYDKLIRFSIEHNIYDIIEVSSLAISQGYQPLGEKGR